MATTKRKKVNPCDTDFIDGPELVLKSEQVSAPVKVRYMGQPRTSGILYNEVSLPPGPFESGSLPGRIERRIRKNELQRSKEEVRQAWC